MPGGDCCNRTSYPYYIPGYEGKVTGLKFHVGNTYSQGTHQMIMQNDRIDSRAMARPVFPDPCVGHQVELRSRLHMLQGEIDPNPCKNAEWNIRNKFCVDRPKVTCPPRLQKMNQHGYLSRLSVYQNPELGVVACKAANTYPCKERAPSQKPFWQEYEDIVPTDPFLEYPPECRHLRLPKLKYKTTSCWDDEFILPIECYNDYCREGYIKPPSVCECLPLDPRRNDEDIKYYRIERDPKRFGLPYFKDPTNPHRYFKSGYTGHVPTLKFRIGDSFAVETRKALNRFTGNYLNPHLLDKCPVYIDPLQYCDKTDYFKKLCDRRKSYDGHFHEKPIRDRLKPVFDPKNCLPPVTNDPYPICIQQN